VKFAISKYERKISILDAIKYSREHDTTAILDNL
jgi:hypothetical protein